MKGIFDTLKMKLKKIVSIYVSVVAVAGNAVSAPDNVEKNSNGLLIHLGQEQVELAAAGGGIGARPCCGRHHAV